MQFYFYANPKGSRKKLHDLSVELMSVVFTYYGVAPRSSETTDINPSAVTR
jgi:hypothetical protein